MRLIDADTLLEMRFNTGYEYGEINVVGTTHIEEAPTIDPAVRCSECKYWHESIAWCEKHSWFIDHDGEPCSPSESSNWKMFNPTDFCSYGERRASEND